jgi:high-affinity iron transporter
VMNWFFHRVYRTGWIRLHTDRKKRLMQDMTGGAPSSRLLLGLVLLGFTAVYREGFEVVLFLQSYRLRLGGGPVIDGVIIGIALSGVVAVLTFVVNHRLPYRKMLVFTGVMLGGVLLVMVGEEAQEMQLAGWLSTTPVHSLQRMPIWLGFWFAIFPTVETLVAQALAALLVLGSFFASRLRTSARANRERTGQGSPDADSNRRITAVRLGRKDGIAMAVAPRRGT